MKCDDFQNDDLRTVILWCLNSSNIVIQGGSLICYSSWWFSVTNDFNDSRNNLT